jgi:hypothetical protein
MEEYSKDLEPIKDLIEIVVCLKDDWLKIIKYSRNLCMRSFIAKYFPDGAFAVDLT